MKIGSLFSGYGGLDMGVQAVLGGETAWFVEYDDAPSKILAHHWPDVPNYGDITAVDWNAVEPVDVLTGGFPCQDLSLAGRRAGMRPGTRSGLWADYLKAIDTLRPKLAVIENVRGLLSGCAESDSDSERGSCPRCAGDRSVKHAPNVRALGRVLIDLARIGYDARWFGVSAADAGAPHGRFRVFVVANPEGEPWSVGYGDDVPAGRGTVGRESSGGSSAPDARSEVVGSGTGLRASESSGIGWGRLDDDSVPPAADASSDEPERRGGLRDVGGTSSPDEGSSEEREWLRNAALDRAYGPAIRRWERVTGRLAPAPTAGDGKSGAERLSARFVEWMMGLPAGHVTDAPITRAEQLKALGNGVVPQQAALALSMLLGSTSHS